MIGITDDNKYKESLTNYDLNRGYGLRTSKGVLVKHIKLDDLDEFGEVAYRQMIMLFCAKPFDLVTSLYKSGIDYAKLNQYQLFNGLFNAYYDVDEIKNLINYMFNCEKLLQGIVGEEVVYVEGDSSRIIINEQTFYEISSFLKSISRYENNKEEKFVNDLFKEMYIEDLIEQQEMALEDGDINDSYFSKLITLVVLESSYKYNDIGELYMHQFYDLAMTSKKREDYNNIMGGIYSGSVDSNKIDMNKYNYLAS